MKKTIAFLIGGLVSVFLYLILIGVYTRLSSDPIIFFASVAIAVIVAIIVTGVIKTALSKWSGGVLH